MPSGRIGFNFLSLSASLTIALAAAAPAAAQTSWGAAVTRSGAIVFCDRVRSTV